VTLLQLALRCVVLASAIASAACATPADALPPVAKGVIPAVFPIRLHRAYRAGDRGMVSTVVHSRRTTVVAEGDRIVRREADDRELALEAIVEVIRVDAAGAPVTLAYTVEHLIVETPAGRTEVLPGGWVVGAERAGGAVTLRSAEPLPREAREALDDILSPLPAESTDDDIFGTAEPQAIGAIWPVNAALAARELGRAHLDVPTQAVQGQSQLVGLVELAGQVCLDVAGELSIRDPRIIDVPGARLDAAELRSTYRKRIPLDPTSPELDATLRIDLDVTAIIGIAPDREGRMTTTSHRETRRRFLPLHRASRGRQRSAGEPSLAGDPPVHDGGSAPKPPVHDGGSAGSAPEPPG
jgi:hypothetical protein